MSPTTTVVTSGVVRTSERVRSSGLTYRTQDSSPIRLLPSTTPVAGDVLDELLGLPVALVHRDEDVVRVQVAELPEVAHRRLVVQMRLALRHPGHLSGAPAARQSLGREHRVGSLLARLGEHRLVVDLLDRVVAEIPTEEPQ